MTIILQIVFRRLDLSQQINKNHYMKTNGICSELCSSFIRHLFIHIAYLEDV